MKQSLAFTLIELLVVIAVIGILSGLIVVSMNGTTDKATIARSQVFSNSLRNSLMSNTVAQYNFNDIADAKIDTIPTISDIKDSWGSNNANNIGTTGPTVKGNSDCISGKCLYFNGPSSAGDPQNGDYVYFPNTNYPKGNNPITLEAWFYTKIHYSSVEIFGACWNDPSALTIYGTKVSFSIYNTSNNAVYYTYDTKTLNINTWYHVVGTYDTNQKVKICLNGDCQLWNSAVLRDGPGYNIIIGAKSPSYLHFNGIVDDARYYNIAMSTSQIKQNYFIGLNSLFKNGGITKEEYLSRINNVGYSK